MTMKNFLAPFVLFVQLLLAVTGFSLHGELLPYGNFENADLSAWSETNGAVLVQDVVYQGQQAARVGWSDLRAVVSTVPGQTYRVTGWVRILNESGSDWGGFRVRVSDFSSWQELDARSGLLTSSHGGDWFPVSLTFEAVSNSSRLQIGYFGGPGREMTVNVDAFSIVVLGDNAPPVIGSATLTPLIINSLPAQQTYSVNASDPDGSIASILWDFGDGGQSSSATGTRQATAPGVYVARVTVYDNNGASTFLEIPWEASDPGLPVVPLSTRIRVDQFGYVPDALKVAVISNPYVGFDSAESYIPGNVLVVRREHDGAVMFSGAPVAWNGGAVHAQSGDRVWWFDFSTVTEPGEYRIHDPANQTASDRFRIGYDVHAQVLRHAVRVFFYQRASFAKEAPYAVASWTDGPSHLQDQFARPVWDMGNAGMERDLRGGWFDAGDYNKYSEWTARAVVELLLAYVQRPDVFTDDFGIPESGNGVPDLLDELKWGMDWLLRMQEPSGAILGKVSVTQHQTASPPSADAHPRYYGPVSTEATAASAAAFALGATVFDSVGLEAYAATLEAAAVRAWNWTAANPNVPFDNTGFASASPQRNAYETLTNRIMAAVMLFERTNNAVYRSFVDGNLMAVQPIEWSYFYAFEAKIQKALAHYARLPGATPASANTIRQRMTTSINGPEFLLAWNHQTDAYRAYMKDEDYVWGSNRAKVHVGTLYTNVNLLGLNPETAAVYRNAAMGYLHYLHGVNPMGMVYLSNMYSAGATRSANAVYHNWFQNGTEWSHARDSAFGPAPGFLVGGPNRNYTGTLGWIRDQPPQKAYHDWNGLWPEDSWQITEPDINYQSGYIHLLSALQPPVERAPFILSQPGSQTVPAGREVRLNVNVDGSTPLTYQWHGPNGSIANSNSPVLTIASLSAATAGTYFVTATNRLGAVTSNTATLAILPVPAPPIPDTPTASGREIALGWSDPSALAEGFELVWAMSADGPWELLAETESSSFLHEGLEGGTTYFYRVRARNAAGAGDWSAVAFAATPERYLLSFGDTMYNADPEGRIWQNFRLRQTAGSDSGFQGHSHVILQNTEGGEGSVTFSASSTITGGNVGQNIPATTAFDGNPFAWFNPEEGAQRITPAFNQLNSSITYRFSGFDPAHSVTFDLVIRRTDGVRNVTLVASGDGGEPETLLDNVDSGVTRYVTWVTGGSESYQFVLTSNSANWVGSINAMSVLVARAGVEWDPFEVWWTENAVFFDGKDKNDAVLRQGASIAIRDIWIAGLDPESDELFKLIGLDADGLPEYIEKPGRQYRIWWTDDLSLAPANWNLLKDFHEAPPANAPGNGIVLYRMEVRIE